jgi:small subunit ribosomal protein S4
MRALGVNLPGFSGKSIEKRPHPPGQHGPGSRRKPSLYATRLREKQKLRVHYGLTERQLRTIAEHAARRRGHTATLIAERLELRLDNVVFRAGFARTIPASRQLVRHGHITVNGRIVDIPSVSLRRGDVVAIRQSGQKAVQLQRERGEALARPEWLEVDGDTLTTRVAAMPDLAAIPFPIEMQLVIEFYS